jgi:hypothetical protein
VPGSTPRSPPARGECPARTSWPPGDRAGGAVSVKHEVSTQHTAALCDLLHTHAQTRPKSSDFLESNSA